MQGATPCYEDADGDHEEEAKGSLIKGDPYVEEDALIQYHIPAVRPEAI